MLPEIFVGLGLLYGTKKIADAGQRKAEKLSRKAGRVVGKVGEFVTEPSMELLPKALQKHARTISGMADVVTMPCASGRAAHKRIATGEYYGDGSPAYACLVCGETME